MKTCKYCGKQTYYKKCDCQDKIIPQQNRNEERDLEIENLFFIERKTYQEIANKYNLSVATIKKIIWP